MKRFALVALALMCLATPSYAQWLAPHETCHQQPIVYSYDNPPQQMTYTSLFAWRDSVHQRLQLLEARQNIPQPAPDNTALILQLQGQIASLNAQLLAMKQSPAPAPIIHYHAPAPYVYPLGTAPRLDPNPGTPRLDPNPGVPRLDPNPGTPKLDPTPGTPQLNPNPGAPKLNPDPGPPIKLPPPAPAPAPSPGPQLDPNPGLPGPGTAATPRGYQRYTKTTPATWPTR